MATQNRVSRRSLRNQTVRIKAWVCATECHPIQQTLDKRCNVPFIGGAFRNSSLQLDQEGHASGRSSSPHERNPRISTIIARLAAPTPPVTHAGSSEKNKVARSTDDGLAEAMDPTSNGAKRAQIRPRSPNRRRGRRPPCSHSSMRIGEVH
jgi:hypothetical protein